MNNGAQQQTNVAVVGGGLAGLAAATYLARAGRSVTVFERSSALGGRAITNELSGYHFNLGPHALYRRGATAKILRELGVGWQGRVPPTSGYGIRDGALHTISQSPLWFAGTRLLSARAKLEAARLLVRLPRIAYRKLQHLTLGAWLEQVTRQPQARQLIEALVRVATYSNDHDGLSAGVAVMQLQLALKGVLYLDHGWQTLVDGLRAAAQASGARIVTGAAVEAIERDDEVRAVRLKDGTRMAASTAIVTAGPEVAAQLVERSDGTPLRRWAQEAVPVRAACLDVGLRRLPRPKQTFALGLDQPLYLSVHSRTAKLAPPGGGATIHVAKYLAPGDTDAKTHERELEACLDLVQPGWRDELAERRYLPNMAVVNATASAAAGGLAGRPGPEVPGVAGLYVAGDWVGNQGWLSDASLASAKRAAELIVQRTATASAVAARSPVTA